jgi:hypothetical protein
MFKIFISHSSKDKKLARRLFEDMKKMGFDPWLDEAEIAVGECILTKINDGIAKSDYIVIILSKNSVNSHWVEKEWKSKYWDEISSGLVTVLPILTDDCAIPKLLQTKKYADFTEGYTIGFAHLMNALQKNQDVDQEQISCLEKMNTDNKIEYYWHRGIQEYFGLILNFIFVKFNSNKSYYKNNSITGELNNVDISNYMIFDLYSEWDAVIRFWTTTETATLLSSNLEHNREINDVNHIIVKDMEHVYDGNYSYPTKEKIKSIIDNIGLKALRDLKKNSEKSQYFDLAISEGILLKDSVSFDPNRIQFYIIIKSLKNLGNAITSYVINEIKKFENIKSKTVYITTGTSIRMIVKGQIDDFYGIDNFIRCITTILSNNDANDATTRTILVATRNVQVNNQFDFVKAEENIVEKKFDTLIKSSDEEIKVPLSEKYLLLSKYHTVIDILGMDDHNIIHNLLKAKLFNNTTYIKNIKDFFPEFEQLLRDNLTKVIMTSYGKNWQEHLDNLKNGQGVKKSQTVTKLVLGDLAKIYKQIVLDGNILKLTPDEKTTFTFVMDNLPVYRNNLAHNAATLKGWDDLFDFCRKFIPFRHQFRQHFHSVGKALPELRI